MSPYGQCFAKSSGTALSALAPQSRLVPHMARLRKLTYSCQLFVNITKRDFKVTRDGAETLVDTQEYERVPLGKVPVMLRSEVCRLFNKDNNSIMGLNECPQDQGGYFIINGSEKVILAQERRANNLVFVFKKTIGKFAYMAEVGSQVERGNKPPSTLYMKLWNRENNKKFGSSVVVTLPYVRKEIPIVIVFRALGIESDREILEHIVYNLKDIQMMEALRPSLNEAAEGKDLTSREDALYFIGKRAIDKITSRDQCIKHAEEILVRELLPHIGITEESCTKKQFFLGYICHRLLACSLGRRGQDDRDHYGNKRVDMAGPLLAGLFKGTFKRLVKDFKKSLQEAVDKGKEPSVTSSLKEDVITRGIKYCMATGNWGVGKSAVAGQATKTGVSQVLSRLTFAAALSHLRRANTPIGKEGQDRTAAAAAQHSVGRRVPCGNSGGAGMRTGQKPFADDVCVRRWQLACHPRAARGIRDGEPRGALGTLAVHGGEVVQGVCQRYVGWHVRRPGRPDAYAPGSAPRMFDWRYDSRGRDLP